MLCAKLVKPANELCGPLHDMGGNYSYACVYYRLDVCVHRAVYGVMGEITANYG